MVSVKAFFTFFFLTINNTFTLPVDISLFMKVFFRLNKVSLVSRSHETVNDHFLDARRDYDFSGSGCFWAASKKVILNDSLFFSLK